MGFFDSIGDFFKDDIYGKILKPVVEPVFDDVIKPVVGDVYQAVKPIIGATGQVGAQVIRTGGNFVERSTENMLNLQGLISNPIFLIGVGVVAIILVPKIVEKL